MHRSINYNEHCNIPLKKIGIVKKKKKKKIHGDYVHKLTNRH